MSEHLLTSRSEHLVLLSTPLSHSSALCDGRFLPEGAIWAHFSSHLPFFQWRYAWLPTLEQSDLKIWLFFLYFAGEMVGCAPVRLGWRRTWIKRCFCPAGVPVSSRVSAKIQQLVNTLKRPKRPPLREFFVDDFEELLEGKDSTLLSKIFCFLCFF